MSDFVWAQQMQYRGKPKAKMIGKDGNVFNLLAIAKQALRTHPESIKEMQERVFASKSYDDALNIMSEYVDIV